MFGGAVFAGALQRGGRRRMRVRRGVGNQDAGQGRRWTPGIGGDVAGIGGEENVRGNVNGANGSNGASGGQRINGSVDTGTSGSTSASSSASSSPTSPASSKKPGAAGAAKSRTSKSRIVSLRKKVGTKLRGNPSPGIKKKDAALGMGAGAGAGGGLKAYHSNVGANVKNALLRVRKKLVKNVMTWRASSIMLQGAKISAVAASGASLVAHVYGRRVVNREIIPKVEEMASEALGRKVKLGKCHWLSPMGLLGLSPVCVLGPASIGPAAVEKSTVDVEKIQLNFHVCESIVKRRFVLTATASKPTVRLVQASNFSWLGFPNDTSPSSRPTIEIGEGEFDSDDDSSSGHKNMPVFLDSLRLKNGTLLYTAFDDHGEELEGPRTMRSVNGKVLIDWDVNEPLKKIEAAVTGSLVARDPSTFRTTMPCKGPRHRRRTPDYHIGEKIKGIVKRNDGGTLEASATICLEEEPTVAVHLKGSQLHVPLLERILELPMDMFSGRLNGNLSIHIDDEESWEFPRISGRLDCKETGFHFYDAPDDFFNSTMSLVFEDRRLYLHDAHGYYGAVPIQASGDLDIVETGSYRLSAHVPGVEVNSLQATLGARPSAYPIAGYLTGDISVTGPLEFPVFSGSAHVSSPSSALVDWGAPPSEAGHLPEPRTKADDAVCTRPDNLVAYDKIPFSEADGWFTFDSKTSILSIHDAKALPTIGGTVRGAGTMWLAPEAEENPDAVNVTIHGEAIPTTKLIEIYSPSVTELPPYLLNVGETVVKATIKGSHLEPVINCETVAPDCDASCTIYSTREGIEINANAEAVSATATLHTEYPPLSKVKAALTHLEAAAAAKPFIAGCDVDCNVQGLDLMLLVAEELPDKEARAQPIRLKLSGQAAFSGRSKDSDRNKMLETGENGDSEDPAEALPVFPDPFSGDITLTGVRVNQLMLSEALKGTLHVSSSGVRLHAKGRYDEHLMLAIDSSGSTEESRGRIRGVSSGYRRGMVSMRNGKMRIDGQLTDRSLNIEIASLRLDDLELASLRGVVEKAVIELDGETQQGRGNFQVLEPRFSGLQGHGLQGSMRWEGDVIRLERVVLQQERSRYEVIGEYTLRSTLRFFPDSTGDSFYTRISQGFTGGRWRWTMVVPGADITEILPAARLLSQAGEEQSWEDYLQARAFFLDQIEALSIKAGDISDSIISFADLLPDGTGKLLKKPKQKRQESPISDTYAPFLDDFENFSFKLPQTDDEASEGSDDEVPPASAAENSSSNRAWQAFKISNSDSRDAAKAETTDAVVPGLQELRGKWRGIVQGYSGGSGAAGCEFDVRLNDCEWGPYTMTSLATVGGYHAKDGLRIENLSMESGRTALRGNGTLFGPAPSASFVLSEFPIQALHPLAECVTAGENEVKDILSKLSKNNMSKAVYSGKLFGNANVSGTQDAPQVSLNLQVMDGIVGDTELGLTEGHLYVTSDRRLDFDVHTQPSVGSGHLSVKGSLPLADSGFRLASKEEQDDSLATAPASASAPAGDGKESRNTVSVDASVKDSGMLLLCSLNPYLKWENGNADLKLSVRGTLSEPHINGMAQLSRGTVVVPWLSRPLSAVGATVTVQQNLLNIESLDCRLGRRGFFNIRGKIPITPPAESKSKGDARTAGLNITAENLDIRMKSAYSGMVDAKVSVHGNLLNPIVGGNVQFSKGSMILSSVTGASGTEGGENNADREALNATALASLTGMAKSMTDAVIEKTRGNNKEEVTTIPSYLLFRNLSITLGPEMRVVYPFFLNFSIDGSVEFNGPADPKLIQPSGQLRFDSGEVNLLATTVLIDREHTNTATFVPEQGLDPNVDVSLVGADLRALVNGPASQWQNHVALNYFRSGDPGGQLTPGEAARIFENQIGDVLLEQDGQLAFSRMAAATVATMLPKIETQGMVGKARWRLVSAPSLPGLMGFDPVKDPLRSLANLGMAQHAELQYGRAFIGSVSRRSQESEAETSWRFSYQLSHQLRAQLNSSTSTLPSLILAFSTDGPSQ